MNWKIAALAGFSLAAYLYFRQRGGLGLSVGVSIGAPPAGALRRDERGADALALRHLAFGPKAVAEGAKAALLGPSKAAAREAEAAQIKG